MQIIANQTRPAAAAWNRVPASLAPVDPTSHGQRRDTSDPGLVSACKGQKHYSGTYWSATQCDHVIYESRLELARLLFADFDTSVLGIIAQPFLLTVTLDGTALRHVPDFLLLTTTGPAIVDVKPAHRVTTPKVAVTFAWTRQVVESRGWRYEVWSEPPTSQLENIRLLAGYRRPWLFDQHLMNALMSEPFDGVSLTDVISSQPRWPSPSLATAARAAMAPRTTGTAR
ncbi:TnsA-like heteromeric transposase endonuclease subunit [Streptosporangium sp. KLBMP 9127]|nr:TnsA-like heteromeric transposase endonuclease subunit [Streptosporangium sp. KLBMP 9127]